MHPPKRTSRPTWMAGMLLLAACVMADAVSAGSQKPGSHPPAALNVPPADVASALPPDPECMPRDAYIESTLALLEQHAGNFDRGGARTALEAATETFYRSKNVKLELTRLGDDALEAVVARDLAACHFSGYPLSAEQVDTMLAGLMDVAGQDKQSRIDMATLIALDESGFRPCDTVIAPSCPSPDQDHWLRAYDSYVQAGHAVLIEDNQPRIEGITDEAAMHGLQAYAVAFIEMLSYQPSALVGPDSISATVRIKLDPCRMRAFFEHPSQDALDFGQMEATARKVMERLPAPGIKCGTHDEATIVLPSMRFQWPG